MRRTRSPSRTRTSRRTSSRRVARSSLGVNKWDGLDTEQRDRVKRDIDRKLAFLAFADSHFISAKHGRGIGALMRSVDHAYAAAMSKLPTPRLTRVLQQAVERQQPPRAGLVRPKLRYAHQGGMNPPRGRDPRLGARQGAGRVSALP